jgi:hypothetical protein
VITFFTLAIEELKRARTNHDAQHSAHEAYAVILEEVEEFWEQVRLKRQDRSKPVMLMELIQIAAMAARAAEDLNLLHDAFFLERWDLEVLRGLCKQAEVSQGKAGAQ